MDLHLLDAEPSTEERDAVDALLGPPTTGWEGGVRDAARDSHVAHGGHAARAQRHLLLPALHAVQSRVGWVSEGALNYICTRLTVPPADAWGVATFYALFATTPRPKRVLHVCDDVACRCNGSADVIAALEKQVGPEYHPPKPGAPVHLDDDDVAWMRSPCLGMCDRAPAVLRQRFGAEPHDELLGDVTPDTVARVLDGEWGPPEAYGSMFGAHRDGAHPTAQRAPLPQENHDGLLLLKRAKVVNPWSFQSYRHYGGYLALERAVAMGPEWVIAEVTAAKLLGRGGAAFPTGRKWEAVAKQPARPHYLVCNADESEPGTFKDRMLLDNDPFAIVEAMTIAGFATGCEKGFLYIRGEYPQAMARVKNAIGQARIAGMLGRNIMGKGFDFDIEVRRGAGAYICGEETALFNSIEGLRGEPRNKPPFPVQAGLFGKPTVVNNVETLANVPHIVLMGGEEYAKIGTEHSSGTRLFCVSGCVTTPGLYEAANGITARELLEMAGGVRDGRPLKSVLLGGAAGVFIRPDELDMSLSFEGTRAANATLGSGVFMVFDDTVDLQQTVLRIAAFFRDESCGQCVPCRVGTVRQEEALHRIAANRTHGGVPGELALLHEVGAAMKDASICGLGQTAYSAVESAIHRLRLYEGVKA
jgi:NADH-quinone oxidoreductase subunit F